MPTSSPDTNGASIATYDETKKYVGAYISNVRSDVIEITEDKLENILLKYLNKLTIRRTWAIPLSIFLTSLLATITKNFSDTLGISKDVWQAFFILLTILSLTCFIISIIKLKIYWKTSSLDYVMSLIKKNLKKN